jgi:hypothetical protein
MKIASYISTEYLNIASTVPHGRENGDFNRT